MKVCTSPLIVAVNATVDPADPMSLFCRKSTAAATFHSDVSATALSPWVSLNLMMPLELLSDVTAYPVCKSNDELLLTVPLATDTALNTMFSLVAAF